MLFDLKDKELFKRVTDWLKEIREYSKKMPIELKSDLVKERYVTQEEIDKLCKMSN